jgi:hypothetical protein
MQWFERAGWAFVIIGLLALCCDVLGRFLPWPESDLKLAWAVASCAAGPLFFLLYKYLPVMLGKVLPSPRVEPRARRG